MSGAGEGARAQLCADWALAAHQRGEHQRAVELARRALAQATAARDDRALAQAYNITGVLQRKRGDLSEAVRSLEQGSALAKKLGDTGAHAAALNNLALALAENGDAARGEQLLRAALADVTRQGDRHREAALRNNLADLLHAQAKEEEAMGELRLAVALFSGIRAQAGEPRAETWKLAES